MGEQMTNLDKAAWAIVDRNDDGYEDSERRAMFHFALEDARAALTAIGMTEAQQLMPVGSLAIVPDDVAKRRAEHAARVADAYDRIRRAGRPAARPGSEG